MVSGEQGENMNIKFYVAAKFARKKEVREIYRKAEKRGWTVTEDWTRHDKVEMKDIYLTIAEMRAHDDIEGVINADVFIMLADESGPGMYVEFGAAIAYNELMPDSAPIIYILCPEEMKFRSIFFYHPYVRRVDIVEEIFEEAERLLGHR